MQVDPKRTIWQPAVQFCKAGWNYLSKKMSSLASWVNTLAQRVFKTIHDQPQNNAHRLRQLRIEETPVVNEEPLSSDSPSEPLNKPSLFPSSSVVSDPNEEQINEEPLSSDSPLETLNKPSIFPSSSVVSDPNEEQINELTQQAFVLMGEMKKLNGQVAEIDQEIQKLQEEERKLRHQDWEVDKNIREKETLLNQATTRETYLKYPPPYYVGDAYEERQKVAQDIELYREEIKKLKLVKNNQQEIADIAKQIQVLETNKKELQDQLNPIVQQRLGLLS